MNAKTHSQQRPFTVAAIQFNPEIFEFDRNLDRACAVIEEAAVKGARLIVLPEAALSGYIYRDLDQFLPFMDTVPGVATTRIAEVTAQYDCYVAIGIAEVDKASGLTYNTGALIGPRGFIGKYRKNGLNPSDIDWFAPGNTGYPVFQTELGAIAMVICYDDTYWEPGRLPMLKGADIIAYICSSDRPIPKATDSASVSAHSTIAAVQQLVAWNGLAMVAADRNNAETNPTTGVTVTYGGAASIWQATGERIAHAPATDYTNTMANPGSILYAEIDPSRFDNDQRRTIDRRRPDLYGPLAYFRAPIDPRATTTGQTISATALQYRTVPGDFDGNVQRAMALADRLAGTEPASGLLVLPAFSFTGRPASDSQAGDFSEAGYGRTVQVLGEMAARLGRHVVGSHIESDEGCLFHTCVLVGTDGTVAGTYRQTHPDPWMTW
ncbi:MAG: carbon-nitrogen hydrolase, partial [Actinobacteria bacterium]|nr:carbon-nitrogen hydrolase [Actinomycetota bacterium]